MFRIQYRRDATTKIPERATISLFCDLNLHRPWAFANRRHDSRHLLAEQAEMGGVIDSSLFFDPPEGLAMQGLLLALWLPLAATLPATQAAVPAWPTLAEQLGRDGIAPGSA